ncbi:MAG: energy transducer TonB [Kiritimatiellales bacterium]|nr:energy transducer TonB [Kiritimatiellales bacterium]
MRKTVLKRVFGTHLGVLFLLLFIPWIKGCFHPKPKPIVFTFALAPPAPAESIPEPEPPAPAPKPKPVPEPPKTNAPPKKVEAKKPEPKKEEPKKVEPKKPEPKPAAKPKTLEERLAEVRKGGKTIRPAAPAKPALDYSGLKSALNSASSGTSSSYGSGSGNGVYSPFAGYYAQVQQKMVQAWQQPAGAPKGITAEATIRVERDGTVSSKSITRRSGNPEFDQSVQDALAATTRLPAPPADLPSRDIEIEFVLSQ